MSYVVLARKYRPRRFSEMVGQEHVVQALSNALQTQRLHHAYLFTGTRGIGKTTVSRILAKSLNCTGPDGNGGITAEPCGVCSACTEIDADRYIDYIELDAASNRSIDEIRDLIERAAYKPGTGRFKVFMIDEAHQLTKDAFNALLKTLEEPPEYLKFVLATTDPEKMLPTVLSRCLQFNLRPMAPATVREHLQRVLAAENIQADDGALRLLARAARGSMRDGLSLTDQAIAYGGGRLDEQVVRTMLGSVDRGHARAIVTALAQRDGAAVLAAVDGLRGLALSASGTLEAIALLLQQMAVEQAVPGALDTSDPDTEDARALAGLLAPDETQLLYSMVLHGREELGLMSDEYGALTMVLLRFLAFPGGSSGGAARAAAPPAAAPTPRAAPLRSPAPPAMSVPAPVAAVAPVVARPAAAPVQRVPERQPSPPVQQPAERRVEPQADRSIAGATSIARPGAAAPATRTPPPWEDAEPMEVNVAEPPAWMDEAPPPFEETSAAPAAVVVPAAPAVAALVTTALGDRWYALVKPLCEQGLLTARVGDLAMRSELCRVDANAEPPRWQIVVEQETLRATTLRDKLAAVLAQALGHALQLDVEAGTPNDTVSRRDAAQRLQRQAEAEQLIQSDPVVRELLAQFKTARIVPGSIKPLQT